MLSQYFFPTTADEQQAAISAPLAFFVRELARFAATLALVLVVLDVAWPRNVFAAQPRQRLYFIIVWSALMAAWKTWAARRVRQKE